MDCASVENILDLYQDRRLTPRRMRAVAAHLGACPACSRLLRYSPSSRLREEGRGRGSAAPSDLLEKLEKLLGGQP